MKIASAPHKNGYSLHLMLTNATDISVVATWSCSKNTAHDLFRRDMLKNHDLLQQLDIKPIKAMHQKRAAYACARSTA